MLRRTLLLLVVVMLGASTFSPAVAAGDPPIKLPSSPKGLKSPVTLPSALDAPSSYAPQTSCNPVDMAGVIKVRDLVLATYKQGGKGAIHHGCTEGVSEHSEGRAWDWMVNVKVTKEKAAAADFISWATKNHGENAKRLGIMYIIYNKKIWAIYREKDGWRANSGHTDHVHVSFGWNGARGNTSFWTGKVEAVDRGPCTRFAGTYAAIKNVPNPSGCNAAATLVKKTNLSQRAYGSKSTTIASAQRKLGVKATSSFDSATWAAVKAYQAAHDIPTTGALDHPTWASLYPGAHVTSDVAEGYSPSTAAAYGLERYAGTTIKHHQGGKAVLFAQTAMGMPWADRNGYFGAVTVKAVKKLQAAAGLAQSGTVGKSEWKAMAAALD